MSPSHVKNIAIFPLQWGLGHAGRMIPLAILLKKMGHNVFIASSEEHIALFRKETEGLNYILSKSFSVRYSEHLPQWAVIIASLPRLLWHTVKEHYELKQLVKIYGFDAVISDSRPGLWHKNIRSAFVSHIPGIPLPWFLAPLKWTGYFFGRLITSRYNLFIIPDMPGEPDFAGKLSHPPFTARNARYCGILSRFSGLTPAAKESDDSVLLILSGPEPQRSILRKTVETAVAETGKRLTVLGAQPSLDERVTEGNITSISHAGTNEMAELIMTSGTVITRSGYTTVMELASLGRTAVIIPTPGQSEQEYLAWYLDRKRYFRKERQENFRFPVDRWEDKYSVPEGINERCGEMLQAVLSELLEEKE